MEKNEIKAKLTPIFRGIFNDDSLILSNELNSNDIDRWDSLTHMILIAEIENLFSIKFKLKDLNKMKNVGDMVDIIDSKLS
jgi:acyl carrier protein